MDEVSNVEDTRGIEIESLIKGTFGTPNGKKCLDHLKKVFVDRAIYIPGMSYDEVAFREGERSVIMKLIKEAGHV